MPAINIPNRYIKLISNLPEMEVSFGAGGIRLFTCEELEKGQVGYSVDLNGTSLCGEAKGDWKSSWLVIGSDTGVGDPIFVDTADPKLTVLSAIHGEGAWDPKPIAISIEAFGKILFEFRRIAEDRSNPVESESNPITAAERNTFLSRVGEINERKIESEFWNELFAYVCD
ncbi:MAG: hypothetical protein ABSB50_06065 [Terracidiphilus sp.]|jgi:hypothetical protein